MDYNRLIAQRDVAGKRPVSCEFLLLEPITDAPPSARASSYPDWIADHGDRLHFYCGGLLAFLRTGAVAHAQELYERFGTAAVKHVERNTDWHSQAPSGKGAWGELSNNQVRAARNAEPMLFQKAALVVASCELALADAINRKKKLKGPFTSGEDVYIFMSIIPACWNIDEFDKEYLAELERCHPGAKQALRDSAGQTAKKVIEDLSDGHTVTRETAMGVKQRLMSFPQFQAGAVRARPGRKLGRLKASPNEDVDQG